MITIFNRRELTITFDIKKQAKIRDLLAQNNIPYIIKVVNRKSPSAFDAGLRARTGTFGENLNVAYEYIFYVKRSNYEYALAIINGKV